MSDFVIRLHLAHVRDQVFKSVDAAAEKARAEIKAMCEVRRRSLGQTVRWQIARLAK